MKLIVCSLLLVASTTLGGCFWVTTKSEGEALQKDVNQLQQRVSTKEETVETKVKRLQEVIDEATGVLKRNSADLGADVEGLSAEMRSMRGLLTAAKRYTDEVQTEVAAMKSEQQLLQEQLSALAARIAALEKNGSPITETAGEAFEKGKAAFEAGNFEAARELLKRVVVRYPGYERADNAQYMLAESYLRERQHDPAITEFQRVWTKWEKSSLADDALFRAGEAAQALKHCTEARAYFGLLRQKYPRSSFSNKAKAKDRELRGDSSNSKKCES